VVWQGSAGDRRPYAYYGHWFRKRLLLLGQTPDDERATFGAGIVLDAGSGDCLVFIGEGQRGQKALKLLEQRKNVVGRVPSR